MTPQTQAEVERELRDIGIKRTSRIECSLCGETWSDGHTHEAPEDDIIIFAPREITRVEMAWSALAAHVWALLEEREKSILGNLAGYQLKQVADLQAQLEDANAESDLLQSDKDKMNEDIRALQAQLAARGRALIKAQQILTEPGTPQKSVWRRWQADHAADLAGLAPSEEKTS